MLAGNRTAPNLRRRVEGVNARGRAATPASRSSAPSTRRDAAGGERDGHPRRRRHPDIDGWAMVGGWALYTKTLLHDCSWTPSPAQAVKIVPSTRCRPSSPTSRRAWRRCCSRSRRTCGARSASTRSSTRSRAASRCRAHINAELVRVSSDNLARLGASAAGVGVRRRSGRTAAAREIGPISAANLALPALLRTPISGPPCVRAVCVVAGVGRRGLRRRRRDAPAGPTRRRTRQSTWRAAAPAEAEPLEPPAAARGRNRRRAAVPGIAGAEVGAALRDRRGLQERLLLRRHLLPVGLLGVVPVVRAAGQRRHVHERSRRRRPARRMPGRRRGRLHARRVLRRHGRVRRVRARDDLPRADLRGVDGDARGAVRRRRDVRRDDQRFVRTVPVRQRREVSIQLHDRRRLRRGRGVCQRKLRAEAARRAVLDRRRLRVDVLRARRLLQGRVRGNVQVVRDRRQRRRVHRRSERRRSAVAVRGRGRDDLRQRRDLRRRGRLPAVLGRHDVRGRPPAPDRRRRRRAPATAPASA